MRKILYGIAFLLASCAGKTQGNVDSTDSSFCETDKLREDSIGESLNDIRFADFKDKDWLDNEYIRTLRKYLDTYNRGETEEENLNPYRNITKGQFVIANVSPSPWGGLRIHFMFIDHPEHLFCAYVYSTVDMDERKVVNYSVHYISVTDNEYEITKEEILDSLKVHPELKLW